MTEVDAGVNVDVLLVGIGGYGRLYLDALRKPARKDRVRICAVVDPMAEQSPRWPALAAAGVPRFDTIQAFLKEGGQADLAVISSPIGFHAEQSCAALAAGMNVLCEKPMAGRAEDAFRMRDAVADSGRFLEIGYQWSFSETIQRLKADVLAGRFGAPLRAKTWVAWPRGADYYGRNGWLGRIRDDGGRWVCDSPANNATAHFLHNMLYLLGPATGRSAVPVSVTAECYRANAIESFDAACCRVETREDVDIRFFTAHCVRNVIGPVVRFVFEEATVDYVKPGEFVATFADGRKESYGDPERHTMRKLDHCLARVRTPGNGVSLCGPDAAIAQTLCIDTMQKAPVRPFDPQRLESESINNGTQRLYVPGLEDAMRRGFDEERLFSEMKMPWATEAVRADVASG